MSRVLKERRAKRVALAQRIIEDHARALTEDRMEMAKKKARRRKALGMPEWPRRR